MFKSFVKKILNNVGYDILHLPTDPLIRKRMDLLKAHHIDLIFDVGANTGQFAKRLRSLGYSGGIVSFEPLSTAYKKLALNTMNDPKWQVENFALGDSNGESVIHISQNSYSSSILEMLPDHLASAPDSIYIDKEIITVRKLDDIIDNYYNPGDKVFVKIDTQGYEKKVLKGCQQSLNKIEGFQLEMSLTPLYHNEPLIVEMITWLKNKGYLLNLIETGHMNYNTGEILQVEGYFFKHFAK